MGNEQFKTKEITHDSLRNKILTEISELTEEELESMCINESNSLVIMSVLEHKRLHQKDNWWGTAEGTRERLGMTKDGTIAKTVTLTADEWHEIAESLAWIAFNTKNTACRENLVSLTDKIREQTEA